MRARLGMAKPWFFNSQMKKQYQSLISLLQISQSNVASQNSRKNQTKITDLPLELLLMIYEDFDVTDLHSVARLHPVTRHAAEIKFRDLFRYAKFIISRSGLFINKNGTSAMNIGDMDAMYSILKSFGRFFTNLTLNYDSFSEWEAGRINARLSKHVTDSLVDVSFTHFNETHFKHLTGPFSAVEVIKFNECYLLTAIANLSTIFPSVREIQSGIFQNIADLRGFFEHHFPNLQKIEESWRNSNKNDLGEVFGLNPQLRNLSLYDVNWEFLSAINNTLPQLEHLEIQELLGNYFKISSLHFEHMKSFKIWKLKYASDRDRFGIEFGDNLEEVHDHTEEYVSKHFIFRKNLKKLYVSGKSDNFQEEHFLRIAELIPDLETFETEMYVYSERAADQVVEFIETAQNLKLLKLHNCRPQFQQLIKEKLGDEWEMIQDQREGHILQKVQFVRRPSSEGEEDI